jgi:N-ethylmaleimide reductase
VEIQGGNGFLVDQFLHDGANLRTDAYGGSIDRRARFLFEVLDGVAGDIGADRVGLRLSPHGSLGGLSDTDTEPHFRYVIRELNSRGLAWLHLVEPRASAVGLGDDASLDRANNAAMFREDFSGSLISAGGYGIDTGAEVISSGLADAVAFGRLFIANPDLVERIRRHAPLNTFDRARAYGGGAAGYTDYPFLSD